MKLISLFLILVLTACSSGSKNFLSNSTSGKTTDKQLDQNQINTSVKEQKKTQAMLDLPIRGLDLDATLTKIAFVSCFDQDLPAPILKTINNENLDLYVTLGDNVYAGVPEKKPIADQYKKLDKIEDWRLLRSTTPMMAIWDDHDYGQNDGGYSNPEKEIARRDFLNYFPYVRESLAKGQQGLYHSRMIGPKGKQVHIIMLDTRWDRSDLVRDPNAPEGQKLNLPNEDKKAHVLSDAQWAWLEKELKRSAQVTLLVSSIQVIANKHQYEKWGNFPKDKEKLYDLIKKTKTKNLFIISGDRHLATLAKEHIQGYGDLYDLTASSINKSKNFTEDDPTYIVPSFGGVNYALANIDWNHKKIKFEVHDVSGDVKINFEQNLK